MSPLLRQMLGLWLDGQGVSMRQRDGWAGGFSCDISHGDPPVNIQNDRRTHTTENITFPDTTSYVDGKYLHHSIN